MKKKHFIIAFLFFTKSILFFSQKEANIWYFGKNLGIDFNTANPTVLTNSAMFAWEGCASICDTSGNFLFYTNGDSIWNKNHVVMANGNNIMGDKDATQSSVIVPDPGNTGKYYVFTVDNGGGANGFRYSIVDMNLNTGLGAVTGTKNVLLKNSVVEKLAAIKHANGKDYWVVSHGMNNIFYAYLVTSAGVAATSVNSAIGLTHTIATTIGYMKFSPNGKKIALVTYAPSLERFDFNNETGTVSNLINIPISLFTYGLSFSPDNCKLYARTNHFSSSPKSKIFQYDLSSGVAATIIASQVLIGSSNNQLDALQIGPDGKIYVAKAGSKYLGVINSPNILGTGCNYVDDGFFLSNLFCNNGLTNFVESYFDEGIAPQPLISGKNITCSNSTETYYTSNNSGNSYSWKIKGNSVINGTSSESSVIIDTHTEGTDTLIVKETDACGNDGYDTLLIAVKQRPLTSYTASATFCEGDSVYIGSDSPTDQLSYLWYNGATSSGVFVSFDDTYHFTVTDTTGCSFTDSISITSINCSDPAIYAPNSFSPNGDGLNDLFFPTTNNALALNMEIYNRWGELIFKTNDPAKGWDGSYNGILTEGVYVYVIDYMANDIHKRKMSKLVLLK